MIPHSDHYYDEHPEESVLKPIGELAQLIQRTPLEDLIVFTVLMAKTLQVPVQSPEIIIGWND